MNAFRSMMRKLFGSSEPDPELERALDEVDRAAARFDEALTEAHTHGVFTHLQRSILRASGDDEDRLRRARRRPQ